MNVSVLPLSALGALALAACSAKEATSPDAAATESAAATTDDSALTGAADTPATSASATGSRVLALEGLGDLAIGEPVPAGSSFAERGAHIPGSGCKTVSSPEFPGVYAITEGGQVRRITVGQRSDIKLVEGIGVGATEAEALAAFPGFRASPHKYVGPPAKYLVQPGKDPRLLFEIGEDGRVSLVHVGVMPQLGYVEGCA